MSMAPEQSKPATADSATQLKDLQSAAASSDTPSATAKMVCGPEILGSVMQSLNLTKAPHTTSSWHNDLFSCTYELPMGTLVLSVQQSKSDAAAGSYFATLRPTLGRTETLIGLGKSAYGTSEGTVVVVKDDKTLRVDATRLPAVFGSNQQKRADYAYEIASDVLGCWTGSDYGAVPVR